MCIHKRESDRKISQQTDKINKTRAAERRGATSGVGHELRRALEEAGGLVPKLHTTQR